LYAVALTSSLGAGSADFYRFIHNYYLADDASKASDQARRETLQEKFGRTFHEQVWKWVATHPDIRIIHNNQGCQYSLVEFEKAEHPETVGSELASHDGLLLPPSPTLKIQPAESLLALRTALRQRLSAESRDAKTSKDGSQSTLSTTLLNIGNGVRESIVAVHSTTAPRQPRRLPEDSDTVSAVFDDPASDTSKPRLYASQSRIWQALTGHSMDLKKVPTMEFALLSIIAANGTNGIAQPDLTHLSGQDKRSVPHRTDELARKGYIVKNPVQAGKIRTSLCVHTKFVSQNHFTSSGEVEDVFQVGTFVASGFMQLLYNKFKDAGVVPTRDIRTRLVNIRNSS
jgi:hypothetical protein